ncbi:unnamed protein product [Cochlearia groenlandica]
MEDDKPVKPVKPSLSLQGSVSFGKFENDESLSWEKFSAFSPNKYLEEVGKCATRGSVAQKKAYFEAHYKKIAEKKAEIMLDQEKVMDNNASFRSVVTDKESVEGGGSVTEIGFIEGSNGSFNCEEEDKHVTDIVAKVSNEEVNEEVIVVKECQSLVDHVQEEVKKSLDSPKLEKAEEIVLVDQEEEEENEVREELREETISRDGTKDTNETMVKEANKEKKHNLIKKNDGNVRINPARASLKVTTKPTTNKIVTSKKTPPSKDLKSKTMVTKKPTAPISKATPRFASPNIYNKSPSQVTSLSTSYSSIKKETLSSLLRNKQTGPKSLHMSMSLGPSASASTSLTSTRKSLIMERMGDKDIVKRAFKTFQKSFDYENSIQRQNTDLKQNSAKTTSSIPSLATRQKECGRPIKASSVDKRKEAGVIDAKTRRETLKPKERPVKNSLPVRTLPKRSSDKVLG